MLFYLRGAVCCTSSPFSSFAFSSSRLRLIMALADMRRPYRAVHDHLDESNAEKDPFVMFSNWFHQAKDANASYEPNAMALATSTKNGVPSLRMVLLKGCTEEGFVFFTNYESRKGMELTENPVAALMFYWDQQHRQIRVEGNVERVKEEESDSYFESRPKPSQCAATVSQQSRPIPSRQYLDDLHHDLMAKHSDDKPLPRPPYWGGFRLIPRRFEFWQGQTTRLHDRLIYERSDPNSSSWKISRIAP